MALHTYEIPRRHRHCVIGGEEFAPSESYFSLLESIKGGYDRKDYCPACWQKLHAEEKEHFEGKVYWKSSVPAKLQVSDESLRRDERALELLKTYSSSNEQKELDQAFILALLLTRNKLLQLKQKVEEENGLIQLYEVRSSEEMIGVRKVDLSYIQTDLIQTELAEKLGR